MNDRSRLSHQKKFVKLTADALRQALLLGDWAGCDVLRGVLDKAREQQHHLSLRIELEEKGQTYLGGASDE